MFISKSVVVELVNTESRHQTYVEEVNSEEIVDYEFPIEGVESVSLCECLNPPDNQRAVKLDVSGERRVNRGEGG